MASAASVPHAQPGNHRSTRRRILDAASECFERYSIRHTSMEEVARISGLSRQTIYRHFQGKDELIAAVSETKVRTVTEMVRKRIVDERDSRTRIITAIAICVEQLVTDRQMREMVEGDYKELLLRGESADVVVATSDRWVPILQDAIADGTMRPDTNIELTISWLTDIQMLLALRVIVFGRSLDDMRGEIEMFVIDGLCRR